MSSANVSAISEELQKRIEANKLEVPLLPEVAGKVVRLTQDPDSEASDLAKLIQSDQTLAGHVMRVANSAAYSPNSTMVSLQQAITRLGMRLIAEIALSASINTRLFNTPGFEKHIAYEIKYSLASALWAKEVARACRKNVEAAFLSGLLHDIGRPVAIQSSLEIAQSLKITPSKEEILHLEQKHQHQIGVKVVETWEMPSSVIETIRYFNDYTQKHSVQLQTMIVKGGALVASHFMCEDDCDGECMGIEELKEQGVFADLNLYPDQVDELLEREEAVNNTLETMTS